MDMTIRQFFIIISFIFMNIILVESELTVSTKTCPYGYSKVLTKDDVICVKLGKKSFFAKKHNVCGSSKMRNVSLSAFKYFLNKSGIDSFWLDYRRIHDNGPFIDWDTGIPLNPNFTMGNFPDYPSLECIAFEVSSFKLQPRDCSEELFSLCVAEPLQPFFLPNKGPCEEKYSYFSNPEAVCLTKIYTNGYEGFKSGTRDQIESFCRDLSGSLIGKGLIYKRNSLLSLKNIEIPIDMKNSDCVHPTCDIYTYQPWFDPIKNSSEEDDDKYFSMNASGELISRHKDYVYNAGICEHPINKLNITLKFLTKRNIGITIHAIYLNEIGSNYLIETSDFWCFTDAKKYYPIRVNVAATENPLSFDLEYVGNGNYWCRIVNTTYFNNYESDHVMFVDKIKSLFSTYVVSFQFSHIEYRKMNESDMTNYFYEKLYESSVNKLLDRNEITKYFQLKRIFMNGTLIYNLNMRDLNFDKKMMPNLIQNISQAEEVVDLNHILLSNNLKNGFMVINVNQTFGETKICELINESCFCISYDYQGPSSLIFIKYISEENSDSCEPKEDEIIDQIDDVSQIDNKLKNILKGTITNYTIEEIVGDISNAMLFRRNSNVPSTILQNLDTILQNINVTSTMDHLIYSSSSSLAVGVIETGGINPVCALKVTSVNIDMTNASINFLNGDELNTIKENTTETEIIVEMPKVSLDSSGQLAIVVLQNDNFFNLNPNQSTWNINSRVIGISTKNSLNFSSDQYIDIHMKPLKSELTFDEVKVCAYWDFNLSGWSSEGCEFIDEEIVKGFDTCRCRHMTHFAQIIQPGTSKISNSHRIALTAITYIGCILSLIGLSIIFLTAILFERWRNEFTNKIYLNLSVAIAFLLIIFMIGSTLNTSNTVICLTFGSFLHYIILAAFCWMLISAVLSYKKLVNVFNADISHRLLRVSLCGWIIPFAPVLLLLSISPTSYVKPYQNPQNALFCYPSGKGYWITVFTPILLIVITNLVFYGIIVYKVFIKTSIQRSFDNNKINRRKIYASFLLFFLFGLTWIFGFLSRILIMNYLFCITAPLQGFVLFVFFILNNTKTRNMWYKKLGSKYFSESKYKDTSNRYWVNKKVSSPGHTSKSKVIPSSNSITDPSTSSKPSPSDIPLIENEIIDPKAPKLIYHSTRRMSDIL